MARDRGRWMNKRSRCLHALVLLCVVFVAEAVAAPCCERGLLFRLDQQGSGHKPSWLFGTIHSDDPRVTKLPEPVLDAFDRATVVVLEVVPDAAMLEAARAAMLLSPDEHLEEILPPVLYRDILAALAERGMPAKVAERLQPWAVLLVLSMPPASAGAVLDVALYQRALDAGKPVQGLETLAEQLSVFQTLSREDQVALLDATLRERQQLPKIFASLLDAYLARDLDALMQLGQTLAAGSAELEARLHEALIDDRNQRMFERLSPVMRQGGRFVAVGALHLPGPGGLLERLQAAGVEVSRVY